MQNLGLFSQSAVDQMVAEGENGTEIFDMWDRLMEDRGCLA